MRYYDLNNPKDREIIEEFRREIEQEWENDPNWTFEKYLIKKGAWVRNERYPNGAVRNPALYGELWEKWETFQYLRWREEQERRKIDPEFDKEYKKAFKELKEHIRKLCKI